MPSAVKLWQTALKQLQQLPTVRQPGRDETSFPLPTVHEFLTSPRGSSAVWKRLVNELQVPLHLSKAIASASDPFTPRAYAATCALAVLWKRAVADGALVGALTAASSGTLPSSMGQQLQQSGFMAALPRLLEAAAAALADTQHDPALAHVPQHSSYVVTGRNAIPVLSTSRTTDTQFAAAADRVVRAQASAGGLLQVLSTCMVLWPRLFDTAAVYLPAMRLCVTTMQHCSHCADLTSPAAPAPTALEELMVSVGSAVQAVCAAWELQDQDGYHAALQAISIVLLGLTLCPERFEGVTAAVDSSKPRSTVGEVKLDTPDSVRASQTAWQYACSHQSDLSEVQQQVLQELGCSGRAMMYAAQHGLRAITNSSSLELIVDAYRQLGQHCPPLPDLDQPRQLQQLAEALAQLKEGDSPSRACGSRLLPCAALLWLMPAVLLEWVQKQPAGLPGAVKYHQIFGSILWTSLDQVSKHQQWWAGVHTVFATAAGELALLSQQDNAASSTFGVASRVAMRFSKQAQLPASHLVLLLHLTSSAGARIMARMPQNAPQASEGTSSSSSSGRCACGQAARDTRRSGTGAGDGSVTSLGGDVQQLLQLQSCRHLAIALCNIGNILYDSILVCANSLAASQSASSNMADGADDEQRASLASLCTAWQQALPQLASITEAAVRSKFPSSPGVAHTWAMSQGFAIAHQLCGSGLFAAAGLQPGSPALKPLSGMVLTLIKQASTILLAKPGPAEAEAKTAVGCLAHVLCLNSLVLQAACTCATTSSETCSVSDAVASMLSHSKVSWSLTLNSQPGKWGPAQLSIISNSIAAPGAGSSVGGDGAVALVPWLVSLGHCCLSYALVLQQSQAGAAALPAVPNNSYLTSMAQALQEVAAVLPAWLQSDSVSAQLAAAGYSTQRVIELLQSTAQAGEDGLQAAAAAAVPLELLQELGLALCNMPISTACNNSRCSSLAALSEQQLVMGRSRLCAGCRLARYCCRACQVAAWKQHKPACKAVASARAARAAEQGA